MAYRPGNRVNYVGQEGNETLWTIDVVPQPADEFEFFESDEATGTRTPLPPQRWAEGFISSRLGKQPAWFVSSMAFAGQEFRAAPGTEPELAALIRDVAQMEFGLSSDMFSIAADGRASLIRLADQIERDGHGVLKAAFNLYHPVESAPEPPKTIRTGPRPSTRKIQIPWEHGTLYPAPNLQGNGTRNLGRTVSGDVIWSDDQSGSGGMLALVGDQQIARVDLTPGREGEALRSILTQVMSPRTLKTMVGISRLVWERTDRKPLNRGVTVRLGELARAAGYVPGDDRHIKVEIRHRLGLELRALCSISTWAADGPYDTKARMHKGAWAAKLLYIPAIHLDQLTADSGPIPDELDVMLGRNWAEAYANTDLVQIAPGFMKLHDENVIRLGWYYQTEFRYRMTKQRVTVERSIRSLCAEAGIDTGESKHRGRFLERLDKWHAELLVAGVIGGHRRAPGIGEDVPPGEVFARGEYMVRPPTPILEAYKDARAKAAKRPPKQKRTAPA